MTTTRHTSSDFLRSGKFNLFRAHPPLGADYAPILFRHVLPNATVAALTYLPFVLTGSVAILASLDFLGFGLPPGSPSLGELLGQGKRNLHAPWLGLTAFLALALLLSLLVFIGEGLRDAFDPRRTTAVGGGGVHGGACPNGVPTPPGRDRATPLPIAGARSLRKVVP